MRTGASDVSSLLAGKLEEHLHAATQDVTGFLAEDQGFAYTADDHTFADGLFADYATRGIDNEGLSLAVAGITGVAITLAVGWGVTSAQRRRHRTPVAS